MRWRAAQHSALRHAPAGRAHRCPHASGTLETRAARQERGGPCCGRSYPLPRGAPSEAKRAAAGGLATLPASSAARILSPPHHLGGLAPRCRRLSLALSTGAQPQGAAGAGGMAQTGLAAAIAGLSQRGRGSAARATALFPSPHGARLHTSGGRGSAVDSAEGRALGARQVRGEHGAAAAAWGPRSGGGAPRREPRWPSAKRPGVEDRAPALARRHGSPGRRTAAVHTSRTHALDHQGPLRESGRTCRVRTGRQLARNSFSSFAADSSCVFTRTPMDPICRMVYSPRRVQ